MHPNATKVVGVGGGYSGVMAASRVTQRDDAAVTLINSRPRFVHRIRPHLGLGRGFAVVQLASRQDVANRFSIRGRLGAKIRERTSLASPR